VSSRSDYGSFDKGEKDRGGVPSTETTGFAGEEVCGNRKQKNDCNWPTGSPVSKSESTTKDQRASLGKKIVDDEEQSSGGASRHHRKRRKYLRFKNIYQPRSSGRKELRPMKKKVKTRRNIDSSRRV